MRKLDEVVGFLLSSFDELKPRLLAASTGELLGFLGSLNTGEEHPLFPRSRFGVIAEDVANTWVTFHGTTILLSDGSVGDKLGAIFAVKNYPAKTDSLMLDELNLPVDMVVTHSFVPINANIMAGRIKRQLRLMQAANDGAVSLAQELELAQDDLESKRLIFGEHHMTVAVYARSQAALDDIAAEIRNISATSGINLISEAFGAQAHFMAQHPGNTGARSRKAAITNHNFADLATFHRTPLGKTGREVPWGVPITLFPTPERSGFRFNFHEQGAPDREPTGGHTLILGRPGSGKSVLAAFLMTMARRAGARVFVFDYRAGMEMAIRDAKKAGLTPPARLTKRDQEQVLAERRRQDPKGAGALHSLVVKNIADRIDEGWKRFWDALREQRPRVCPPKPIKRKRYRSITYPQYGNGVRLKDGRIELSMIGTFRLHDHRKVRAGSRP